MTSSGIKPATLRFVAIYGRIEHNGVKVPPLYTIRNSECAVRMLVAAPIIPTEMLHGRFPHLCSTVRQPDQDRCLPNLFHLTTQRRWYYCRVWTPSHEDSVGTLGVHLPTAVHQLAHTARGPGQASANDVADSAIKIKFLLEGEIQRTRLSGRPCS
jgi:hypothetical protein